MKFLIHSKGKNTCNHKGFINGKVFANEKGFSVVKLVIVISEHMNMNLPMRFIKNMM